MVALFIRAGADKTRLRDKGEGGGRQQAREEKSVSERGGIELMRNKPQA